MKSIPLSGLLCLLLLPFSCAKAPSRTGGQDTKNEPEEVSVVFRAEDSLESKMTSVNEEAEKAIGRWTVFAFDRESGWFHYASANDGSAISLKLLAGRSYSCLAIVNYPTSGSTAFLPSSVRSVEDFSQKLASLGDNEEGSLLMYGERVLTAQSGRSMTENIRVSRIVSRMDVPMVSVDFSAKPHLAAKTFTLRHIYLSNVYRTTRYGKDFSFNELSGSRLAWYNSGGWHRGEQADEKMDALLGDRDIDAVLDAAHPHERLHSFYAFPNATAVEDDDHQMNVWGKRCTRIILETTLDDETMYYQINVPSMRRNYIYSADGIVIRGRGSKDPEIIDMEADALEVHFSVSANGWSRPREIQENS